MTIVGASHFVAMPHHARSHDEARDVVCILCFKKSSTVRKLTEEHHQAIQEHFIDGLDFYFDHRLPRVICGTCLLTLNEYKRGIFVRKIELFEYSTLKSLRTQTRSQGGICDCYVCETARTNGLKSRLTAKRAGRPASRDSNS